MVLARLAGQNHLLILFPLNLFWLAARPVEPDGRGVFRQVIVNLAQRNPTDGSHQGSDGQRV